MITEEEAMYFQLLTMASGIECNEEGFVMIVNWLYCCGAFPKEIRIFTNVYAPSHIEMPIVSGASGERPSQQSDGNCFTA
jgi:hypothetical protein